MLSDRSQRVVVNKCLSSWLNCVSGVPQGCNLGSLLFNVYFNNLIDCVYHSDIFLYADDADIFKFINCKMDCVLFQQDIYRIPAWCVS